MNVVLEYLVAIIVMATIVVALLVVLLFLTMGVATLAHLARKRWGKPKPAGPSDFGRIRGRMTRARTTTLLLTPAKTPGFSKLGGDPELPEAAEWPTHEEDGAYAFIAQIDLEAFRPHGGPDWLPMAGRFYAFVNEERYGIEDLVRVVYALEPPGPAVSAPPKTPLYPERRVGFETYESIPSLDWLGVDLSDMHVDEDELDELAGLPDAPFGDELQHRIGGYPSEIQDTRMHVDCELIRRGLPVLGEGAEITDAILRAARQWRLLLQVDSDPALKMNWGDGGMLYVFIREKDARAGDFSRTVTISQCY